MLFGPAGQLYVADTKRNSVFAFDAEQGAFLREIAPDDLSFPYLAGLRGDTLLVLDPADGRVDFLADGAVVGGVPLPRPQGEGTPLRYAVAGPEALYVKTVGEGVRGAIDRIGAGGEVEAHYPLPGPPWRHAGLLRLWGDSLLSLSGYRPVVDVFAPGGARDTLPLFGFDSPMLARSRSFALGAVEEAPLLSASAAPSGDHLFVLNMRPGWIQVDVYDRAGRLVRVLTQPDPGFDQRFYPVDLAVRPRQDGASTIAVLSVEPSPRLSCFLWHPPGAGS